MTSKSRGFRRVGLAFGYSLSGLRAAWTREAAFRQETVLALVLTPVALWLGANGVERALLVGSLLLVLVVELLNTGIENVVDRVGSEHHQLAGWAKDVGSAAVMLSIVAAVLVWLLVLLDPGRI